MVSALIYPVILLTMSFGLIALMLFYIIPKFSEFMTTLGTDPPLLTTIIVGLGNFCQANWHFMLIAAVGSVVGVLAWNRTEQGALFFDGLKLKLPLIGPVVDNYAQNRFTRTLATLQAGGIPLVTSLELSARAVGNRVFERALMDVTEQVREGNPLWESLANTELMSDITIQMCKVGESTGGLPEMLNHASDFTDHEIETRLTRIVSLIEPMMLVFMAVVVAVMLLAIYMPMFTMIGRGGA